MDRNHVEHEQHFLAPLRMFWRSKALKWMALPILMIGSVSTRFAATYEVLMDILFCLVAVMLVQHAIRMKEYCWASTFAAAAVVCSPLGLALKIFLLLGLACAATLATLFAAFRNKAVTVESPDTP
jgi:hypothetical protein